jgi:hypothetical protein
MALAYLHWMQEASAQAIASAMRLSAFSRLACEVANDKRI